MNTTYPICKRDGFPIIKIGDRRECVVEYLDRHVGQQKVVDVVKRRRTTYYVFENGYEVPLLCSCCGAPLIVEDVGKTRRDMRGRRLQSMAISLAELEDGTEIREFVLEFSKKGRLSSRVGVPVSFEVAAQMRHPGPRSPKQQAQGKPSEPKRRRRRRQR